MNLYPCCSATPAQTTLADAPIKVPLPKNDLKFKLKDSELIKIPLTNLRDMHQMRVTTQVAAMADPTFHFQQVRLQF